MKSFNFKKLKSQNETFEKKKVFVGEGSQFVSSSNHCVELFDRIAEIDQKRSKLNPVTRIANKTGTKNGVFKTDQAEIDAINDLVIGSNKNDILGIYYLAKQRIHKCELKFVASKDIKEKNSIKAVKEAWQRQLDAALRKGSVILVGDADFDHAFNQEETKKIQEKKKKRKSLIQVGSIVTAIVVLFSIGIAIDSNNSKSNNSVSSPSFENNESITESNTVFSDSTEYLIEQSETTITNIAKETTKITSTAPIKIGELELTMLDVGQGLSILINADGEYLLYDGGGRSRSSYVVAYLKSHGITKLTYVFVSHYDEDHIAGLVGVLNTTTVGTVVDPDYTSDTSIYNSFRTKLSENGAKEVHPSVGSTYSLGNAKITVLGPNNYSYGENSRSVVIRVTYGNFSVIMTGDAESEAEYDMVNSGMTLSSNLYVVGHHGSSSSSSSAFVKAVSPSYAFISVGVENSYGHPTQQTLNTLKNNGVQIFRSDKQGEVTCYSNGTKYWFNEDPCNDYSAGLSQTTTTVTTKSNSNTTKAQSNGNATYVLNTNTKKFHYPSCKSVNQMKEKNRKYVTMSRQEIINQGYQPCGNCKP